MRVAVLASHPALSTVLESIKNEAGARFAQFPRPPRVLQVIASIAEVNGGASTAMWSTLEALRRRNIESDLVTTNENGLHRLADVPFGEFVSERGHRVRYFPASGDRYTTSWPLARWLLRHVRDYDLVHIHGMFRFAPVVAAHIALLRGVPYTLTLHNTLGDWGLRNRRPWLKRLSIGLIEGRMLDRASRVHLCSAEELNAVTRVRPLDERAAVFPLGIEMPQEVAYVPTQDAASDCEEFAGRKIVLFMSRIHAIKGLDTLIRAFGRVRNEHPDAHLVIAGTGEDAQLVANLQDLARQSGIEACTHWVGFVQGQRKFDLLAAACVFVLPSHSENFGYAVIEGALAGLPVIATAQVPAARYVVEAGSGLLFDGTVADLARKINTVLSLPEPQRQRLGALGRSLVRQDLSLESFGQSLETLYRQIQQPHLAS